MRKNTVGVTSNQLLPDLGAFGPDVLWPLAPDELGRHPFSPTPRDAEKVQEFMQARLRVEFGPARRILPKEIGMLATKQLQIVDGKRRYDNRLFSDAPDDYLPKHLLPYLNNGTATIPEYLAMRERLGIGSIELARYTTIYGLGREYIPAFHTYVRQGILAFNPNAELQPAKFRPINPLKPDKKPLRAIAPAVDTSGTVTALAMLAQLNHGNIEEELPVREKQLFIVRFDEESSLANSVKESERVLALTLRHTLTRAVQSEHDWREPVEKSLMLKKRLGLLVTNEYVEPPSWFIPLSSTFYASHTPTVHEYEQSGNDASSKYTYRKCNL